MMVKAIDEEQMVEFLQCGHTGKRNGQRDPVKSIYRVLVGNLGLCKERSEVEGPRCANSALPVWGVRLIMLWFCKVARRSLYHRGCHQLKTSFRFLEKVPSAPGRSLP